MTTTSFPPEDQLPPASSRQSGRGEHFAGVSLSMLYPPSANRLWRAVRGRNIKSAEYRQWLEVAGRHLLAQRPGNIPGRYALTITASRPDNRARDIGNLEKPISDLLVACGVVEDDSLAQRITLQWAGALTKGGAISILVEGAA